MKKLLLLAAIGCVSFPAWADVLKSIKLEGEVQTIASDVRSNPDTVFNRGTNLRVLAGLSAQLMPQVQANILFQYVNGWGNAGAANTNFGTDGATLQDYMDTITVVEANLVLSNLFDRIEATVGRQFYGDESSAVMYFGPTHYISEGMKATSVDGAKLAYHTEKSDLTVILGEVEYLAPLGGEPVLQDKASFYGADWIFSVSSVIQAQVYGYDVRNLSVASAAGDLIYKNAGFYGARLTFTPNTFLFSGEYARNFHGDNVFAEQSGDAGYMFKGDASVSIQTAIGSLTPRAAFIYSADNFRAHGNYSAGIFLGDNYGDIFSYFGEQGVRMFNVGVDVKLASLEKWTFTLDGFTLQDRSGQTAASYEGDLILKYAHNDHVELFAGAAYVKNGTLNRRGTNGTDGKGYTKDNMKGQAGILIRL